MNDQTIKNCVHDIEPWMIEVRRALHQIPELGFEEVQTQAYIMAQLDALGIPYTTDRTWIIGLIQGAREGETIALRADMDALPLTENPGPFSSRNPGRMHACGHDAHMAMVLGAARILNDHRDQLCGNVKLFFQPAEETVGGAKPMVEAGCLDNPKVSHVFGLHIMPKLPIGTVETKPGTLNASTDDVIINVRGKSGHGAYPDTGADAIVCAAQIISALQSIISRNISPINAAVIHIGQINGGVAPNVLCDSVTLRGTIRTANASLRSEVKRRVREVIGGICQAMGCTAAVDLIPDYSALINHEQDAQYVLDTAARLLGKHNALLSPTPSMGGEDFSYFIENTPGAFFHIGCADPSHMPAPALHSSAFTLDERCLCIGTAMHVALVMGHLAPNEA